MSGFLARLFGGRQPVPCVTVVSGLPRSGTSMMMKMLDAGGLPPLTDNERTADDDNPKGYYEFERVKKLPGDTAWLPLAAGKAVKIISMLLTQLPATYRYRVLFMRRHTEEILASQRQMLIRRGEATDKVADDELARMYADHLKQIEQWLEAQSNFEVLYVQYDEVLRDPSSWSTRINAFLDHQLDETKMAAVVDPELYRQRAAQQDS
jgi:hypothetical protein